MWIHRPPAGAAAALMVPPWASTTFLAMASPSPAPPVWRLREPSTR